MLWKERQGSNFVGKRVRSCNVAATEIINDDDDYYFCAKCYVYFDLLFCFNFLNTRFSLCLGIITKRADGMRNVWESAKYN